jgi:hypothetical protein
VAKCAYPRLIRGNLVPCMNCPRCRATSTWKRSARIAAETVAAPRTWWCTFTLASEIPEREAYAEVQKALKRLRKARHKVRYAFVPEWGEANGRLHYHAMIHGQNSLKKRDVEGIWPHGFTRVRLIGGKPKKSSAAARQKAIRVLARYIAKYLTKGTGRFRFSQGYGSFAARAIRERSGVDEVLRAFPGAEVVRQRCGGISMPRKLLGSRPEPQLAQLSREDRAECDDLWEQRQRELGNRTRAPAPQGDFLRWGRGGWIYPWAEPADGADPEGGTSIDQEEIDF